jgi:hypothetical protein
VNASKSIDPTVAMDGRFTDSHSRRNAARNARRNGHPIAIPFWHDNDDDGSTNDDDDGRTDYDPYTEAWLNENDDA